MTRDEIATRLDENAELLRHLRKQRGDIEDQIMRVIDENDELRAQLGTPRLVVCNG